jgi:hypothetical protein
MAESYSDHRLPPSHPSPHPSATTPATNSRTAVPVFHQRLNCPDDTRTVWKPGCFERLTTPRARAAQTRLFATGNRSVVGVSVRQGEEKTGADSMNGLALPADVAQDDSGRVVTVA